VDTVSVETDIAAAPETVWSMISDITRMGEWSPEAQAGIWKRGATSAAVGAQFTGQNANGKKSWTTNCEVTDCDPGAVFSFQVTAVGLKIALWDYRIEPTETGCHVIETWTDQRGGLAKFAGKFASGVADREAHNRAGMVATLAALKAAAEAGS